MVDGGWIQRWFVLLTINAGCGIAQQRVSQSDQNATFEQLSEFAGPPGRVARPCIRFLRYDRPACVDLKFDHPRRANERCKIVALDVAPRAIRCRSGGARWLILRL